MRARTSACVPLCPPPPLTQRNRCTIIFTCAALPFTDTFPTTNRLTINPRTSSVNSSSRRSSSRTSLARRRRSTLRNTARWDGSRRRAKAMKIAPAASFSRASFQRSRRGCRRWKQPRAGSSSGASNTPRPDTGTALALVGEGDKGSGRGRGRGPLRCLRWTVGGVAGGRGRLGACLFHFFSF